MYQRKDYAVMQKKMQELEAKMHAGDKDYDALRKRLDDIGKATLPINKTTLWQWSVEKGSGFPEDLFYHTPPIAQAEPSPRIICAGNAASKVLGTREVAHICQALRPNGCYPQKIYVRNIANFLERFFNEKDFLDNLDKVSFPVGIITNGFMRNYNVFGGETIDVTDRLKSIASEWEIPFYHLK